MRRARVLSRQEERSCPALADPALADLRSRCAFPDVLERENERPPALPPRSRLVRWTATWRSATGGHREARQVAGRRYIMIDSQGLGAVSSTLRGGVSESVIRYLHCPVFMVCGDGLTQYPVILQGEVCRMLYSHTRVNTDMCVSIDPLALASNGGYRCAAHRPSTQGS